MEGCIYGLPLEMIVNSTVNFVRRRGMYGTG